MSSATTPGVRPDIRKITLNEAFGTDGSVTCLAALWRCGAKA